MTKKAATKDKAPAVQAQMTDSLTNLVSGLGTLRDKRTHNTFTGEGFGYSWVELELAYMDNWLSTQIVNVPVDDGLREWREFENEYAEAMQAEEKRLHVKKHYKDSQYWARLFGGSIILMLTDQDLEEPLDLDKVKKGGLKNLIVLDRWDISPEEINYTDPTATDFMLPKRYRIINGQQSIDASHIVRCDGMQVSRRVRQINQGWGDSALRKVLEDVKDVTSAKGGICALIQESNVDVITREGLSDELTTGDGENILTRFQLAAQMKSFINVLLLDANETYDRKEVTFAGLAQILDKLMIWASGAADIPMTRLFGRSAAGMNATGDGDKDNYYDRVSADQEGIYTPQMDQLDQVLVRSALGGYPEDYSYKWAPLYQASGLELAQEDLATSQSEQMRIDQRVLKRSQIAERLMQEKKYSISQAEIDVMKAEEEQEAAYRLERNKGGDITPKDPDFEGAANELEGDIPPDDPGVDDNGKGK